MSIGTQITELVDALKLTAKEAMDVLEATEDATESDLTALGHNGVRDAAKDAHNIADNLLKRLGVDPVRKPKPEPAPEPEAIEPEPEPEPEVHVSEEVLEKVEASLTDAKAKIDERPPAYEEPPASIADLFDPELTARQNQEALQKKYADAMSMREIHLANDEDSKAMELLKKAERYDSGINWNRARLAEVI